MYHRFRLILMKAFWAAIVSYGIFLNILSRNTELMIPFYHHIERTKITNIIFIAPSMVYGKDFSEELKKNSYVKEVIDFINHDKKRPICTPLSK